MQLALTAGHLLRHLRSLLLQRLPALLELAGKTPRGVATLVLLPLQSLVQRFHLFSHIRF